MTSALVKTEWLNDHLEDNNIRIVDIRGKVLPASEPPPHYFSHRAAYEEAHIPKAAFIDWTLDIIEPNSPSNDILNPTDYANLMSRLGIGDEHMVIAYDDANGMFAARFWWTLQYYGHQQAAILDGGWQKWIAENRPTTSEILVLEPATFTPQSQEELRATAEKILSNPKLVLVDVRSPLEFTGQASRAKRAGHIPNAVNIPRKTMFDANGELKSADELRQMFSESGIDADSEIVTYCNSGVSASYGMIALQQAGFNNVSVYDSSWKEWGNDESKPIE